MSDTIQIHAFGVNDRSGKVRWLAEELGLDIDEVKVELGAHRQTPYRELNPFAAIPTVVYRGETLIESTAACIYIAEQHPESGLAVFAKEAERYTYLKWTSIFTETLESKLVDYILAKNDLMPKELQPIYEKTLRFKLRIVKEQLPKTGYILGDRFSLADIFAGYSLKIAVLTNLIEWSDIEFYLAPLMERQAANKAHFFDGLKSFLESSQ